MLSQINDNKNMIILTTTQMFKNAQINPSIRVILSQMIFQEHHGKF